MTQTNTDPRSKAFELWRGMVADFPEEATIDDFRRAYDAMFSSFEVDPEAEITEVDADGVRCRRVTVSSVPQERDVVYFHGGGYMCGNPEGVLSAAARIARASHAAVLVPDYRLAPENAHPAAHDDAVTVIRWAIAGGADPSRICLVGDSAGGGLALSTVVTLRTTDEVPAAIAVWSPWVDMEVKGTTITTHAELDPLASEQSLTMSAQAYLQGQAPTSPTANVLCDSLDAFPPLYIDAGSAEVLLDDSLRLARQAAVAGIDVTLRVTAGVPHVYQYFADFLPEAQASIEATGRFFRDRAA
jgi:monoterpene epsilon-lactone hydrolase